MIEPGARQNESRFQRWRILGHMTPGALPQAGGECCAFGAKYIARTTTFQPP